MKEIYWDKLMKMEGCEMSNASYRAFLDYVVEKCYVESASTTQAGTVKKVIRNRHGIPVCLQVTYGGDDGSKPKIDYISADRVSFFEPWREYTSDLWEYDREGQEAFVEDLLQSGYHWDDDRGCYYNPETEDEVIW